VLKYADFPAFGPQNALLSLLHFLIIHFVSSNNTRWIPEFRILFVPQMNSTVVREIHGEKINPK
jgi:hypothetical protein